MTDIEIEHESPEESIEEPVHEEPMAPVIEDDISGLAVKQLSKAQRTKLIEAYENGSDNPYFKVNRLKNGSYRVTKRSNPLLNETPEQVTERVNKRYEGRRLTTEQMLLEHVFELERKCEVMRMKHKKLKKRYNKLESDIFSDDEEPVHEVNYAEPEPSEPVHEVNYTEPAHAEPAISAYRRPVKRTWRNMLNNA
jgi:hypothetical protein